MTVQRGYGRRRRMPAALAATAAIALLAGLVVALLGLRATVFDQLIPAAAPSPTAVESVTADPVSEVTPDDNSPRAADPVRLEIPAIDVDAQLVGLGLQDDGAMETPDTGFAGWYDLGPRPGEDGPAVLAAHVDSREGPDVFFRLRELAVDDEVIVTDADGNRHSFAVVSSEQADKEALPVERIWSADTDPVLRLITCGGAFDHGTGHYRDNVIVYAVPTT